MLNHSQINSISPAYATMVACQLPPPCHSVLSGSQIFELPREIHDGYSSQNLWGDI
jgi:hypothetical protein